MSQESLFKSWIMIHHNSKAFEPSLLCADWPPTFSISNELRVMIHESWFITTIFFFCPWRSHYHPWSPGIGQTLMCPTMWAAIANKERHLHLLPRYQSLPRFARSALINVLSQRTPTRNMILRSFHIIYSTITSGQGLTQSKIWF